MFIQTIPDEKKKIIVFELIFGMLFSVVIFSTFITQNLTNTYDGMWRQSYYIGGAFEASLGRWLLPVIDNMHYGVYLDPLTSLLSLSAFVIGCILILDLFDVKNRMIGCFSMAVFLSSTFVSIILSYRFASAAYGFAFLFSVMAVYLPVKFETKRYYLGLLLGILMFCLFMSIYQSFLDVYCLLMLIYLMFLITKGYELKKVLENFLLFVECSVFGVILYAFSTAVALKRYKTALNSYHGANSSGTVDTLINIPQNLVKSYSMFLNYFFNPDKISFNLNALQNLKIMWLEFALIIIPLIIAGIKVIRENKTNAKKNKADFRLFILFCVFALLLPAAGNVVFIIAPGADYSLQTTAGAAFILSLSVLLLDNDDIKLRKLPSIIIGIVSLLILYGNIVQIQIDQNAMLEGRKATETLSNRVLNDIMDQNLMDSAFFFVGKPADNSTFVVSPIYHKANSYARYGDFALVGDCMGISYRNYFNNYLHVKLNVAQKNYEDLAYSDEAKEMPSFPVSGYIRPTGDMVLVKISD